MESPAQALRGSRAHYCPLIVVPLAPGLQPPTRPHSPGKAGGPLGPPLAQAAGPYKGSAGAGGQDVVGYFWRELQRPDGAPGVSAGWGAGSPDAWVLRGGGRGRPRSRQLVGDEGGRKATRGTCPSLPTYGPFVVLSQVNPPSAIPNLTFR